jgi:membrane associated rhomboid family serine protease
MIIPLRDDNPTVRFPVVTVALIAVNCFIYFFVQPHGGASETRFTYEHAAIPCEVRQQEPLSIGELQDDECRSFAGPLATEVFPDKNVWFSVVASMFLHGTLLHLAGNMLFLWIFGNNVEDRLGYVGFLAFYLVVGVIATGAHILSDSNSTVPVIGASGAIAGIMGAYLVLWPRARILTWVPLLFFLVIYLPAGLVLALWFGLQFFTNPNEGVAWVAHVGGFAAGVVLALALRPFLRPPAARAPSPRVDGPSWGDPV